MAHLIEKSWVTTAGLRAVVLRHLPTFEGSPMNFRCGYVEVPAANWNYGKGYDDVDVEVHGGLTYASHPESNDYPIEFDPTKSWWFGYDCGHCYDGPEIQDLDYCIAQCEELAAQLIVECEE